MKTYPLLAMLCVLLGCSSPHYALKGRCPQTPEEFAALVDQLRFLSWEKTDRALLDFAPTLTDADKVLRLRYFFQRAANITFEEGLRRLAYAEQTFGLPSRDDRSRIYILLGPPDLREERTQMMPGLATLERFEIWQYPSGYVMTFHKDRFDNFEMLTAGK